MDSTATRGQMVDLQIGLPFEVEPECDGNVRILPG